VLVCPQGHDSAADDYCDVCGTPLTPRPVAVPAPAPASQEACPRCGGVRTGRFCEACGHDFTGATPAPLSTADDPDSGWVAVVTADPEAEDPPAYCPERVFALDRAELRIGRASRSRGVAPEIDLSGAPRDDGISHLHVVLLAQPDGSWQVIDPGSTNGTRINSAEQPIATGVPVALGDGDRIHIGAWTMITIRKETR
jgi:hypothetical protein